MKALLLCGSLLCCACDDKSVERPTPDGPDDSEAEWDGPPRDDEPEARPPEDTEPAPAPPEADQPTLEWVASGGFGLQASDASAVWANPINGHAYLLTDKPHQLRYVNETQVHPAGDWCLASSCEDLGPFTAGRIELGGTGSGICADQERGVLYAPDGANSVRVIDVDPAGVSANTYHRISATITVPPVLSVFGAHDGPCGYFSGLDALLLTAPEVGGMALVDVETGGLRTAIDEMVGVNKIVMDPNGLRAFFTVGGGTAVGVVLGADLSVQWMETDALVLDIAMDTANNQLWIATDQLPSLSTVSLDDPTWSIHVVEDSPTMQHIAVSTDGWLIGSADEGSPGLDSSSLFLLADGQVIDRLKLPNRVLNIVPPIEHGDVLILVETISGDLGFVSVARVDVPEMDTRPPVHAFVMAAIEQPTPGDLADLEAGVIACDQVDDWVGLVIGNSEKLADLEIGVAVGITNTFVRALSFCDRLSVLNDLESLGFELGYMVHDRPSYNCTNEVVASGADICLPSNSDFCAPLDPGCVFPGHPEYCGLGNQECYQRFLDAKSVETEELMPSGAAFVLGADRHGMWEWDWVSAYQELQRADGGRGYDVTAFVHLWAYASQIDFDDVRGKNSGPWSAYRRSEAWAVGYDLAWDQHSAFSELVVLPGGTTSLLKLGELQQSGLFMLDLLLGETLFRYEENDLLVLWQQLRNSVNQRGNIGPNVWYFHLHDLSTTNLVGPEGEEQPVMEYLRAWVDDVNTQMVGRGEVVWSRPSQIRRVWSEVR
jgi:hypothetical protein